jgi:hypothetical protein
MNKLAFVLSGIPFLFLSPANAQPRPDSLAMTCGQAAALVSSRGAIVLGTGRYLYDRFVHHRGFCAITEATKPAWVPTADTPQCFVGYTCIEADPLHDR